MLLIEFSTLILIAKGTIHKANKWQDHWHVQVLLLHVNKADSKYELRKEIAVLQLNSLKISSKSILHCRMEKRVWETHWKCQEGREPRNLPPTEPPSHVNVSRKCEKALSAEGCGENGSDGARLLGAALHSLRAWGASLRDSSAITGAIRERLLKQKGIPTNLTAATDFIIPASWVFSRHQPCKHSGGELSQCFHHCCSACSNVPRELQRNDFDCKPLRAKIIFMGLDKYTNTLPELCF